MMRLSIAGWIESLLFATAVLLYISGESGWILVYAIGISAALSVTTCAVSRRNFTISCSGCSGLHHVGDTVTVERGTGGDSLLCSVPVTEDVNDNLCMKAMAVPRKK